MTTPAATRNPLLALVEQGQSVWYDYLRRSLLTSGELARLIAEDGLRGMTSNPSIFEKAITGSTDYDEQLAELRAAGGGDPGQLFEQIALRDIASAADVFRPVFDTTEGADGFVSIEVSPTLAHDTEGTIAEARRLWAALDRPNVMIKVPATPEGLPAIRALIASGVNVNITLLFGVPVYEQVAEAYLSGLEELLDAGGDASRIASVASFFVSRIDVAVDALLNEHDTEYGEAGAALRGKIAIANAKIAYARYKEIFAGERWERIAQKGAHPQRLLWASTSVKDPALPDVYYVEQLIGPNTIDTVPPATFDAFRDHGRVRSTLEEDVEEARRTLAALERLGISLDEVTDKVLADGVRLFDEAFAKLLAAVAECDRVARRPDDPLPARGHTSTRRRDAEGLGGKRQVPKPLAAGQLTVDRRRRGRMARLAGNRGRSARASRAAPAARSETRRKGISSRMRCCSEWADRASLRRCFRSRSGTGSGTPSCACSTRPTRHR